MNIEAYREYCLQKRGVTEGFPFDKSTLVYKVMDKMFTLTDVETFASITLKCDPEVALQLREMHAEVAPGYYMNKRHWNTVGMGGSIPDTTLYQWIDHSYRLVVGRLSKKDQEWIEQKAQ
jgi:predicted DNA-binding protein (MmcQ/YjbR family)